MFLAWTILRMPTYLRPNHIPLEAYMLSNCRSVKIHVTKKVTETNGSDACPFNYLCWHFIKRDGPLLVENIRMKMPRRMRDKVSITKLYIADLVSKLFLATFLDLT